MKYGIAALSLMASCLAANAAGLDQLKAFLDTNRSARGMFTQTVIAKSGRKPQQSAGIFALQRPTRRPTSNCWSATATSSGVTTPT